MDATELGKVAAEWDAVGRWRAVPDLVVALYHEALPGALDVAARYAGRPERVHWNVITKEAVAWRDGDDSATLLDAAVGPWLLVKRAAEDFLRGPADTFSAAQHAIGGPHPLAASLVGGLLGSGVGYAGGALAEQLLPQSVIRGRKLRKTMAVLGAGAGALPGAAWGYTNMNMPADTGGGWDAWTSGFPFNEAGKTPAASRFDALELPWELADAFAKAAQSATGAMYVPTIPIGPFNQAIWTDVLEPPNPFGHKDYRGDDEQRLATPPAVAAALSGLVAGTGAATGRDRVSPLELGLTAAAAAGKGYFGGMVAGQVLGALAGLTPEAQSTLRQVGLWGGLMSGVARSLFG